MGSERDALATLWGGNRAYSSLTVRHTTMANRTILFSQCLALFLAISGAPMQASSLQRLPLLRETFLCQKGQPCAVILVPDDEAYKALGEDLAKALEKATGDRLLVQSARDVVTGQHLILLGQFWNNPVLSRLYNACFDPTDAFFPGPRGFELRTVCSPFVHGQNCIVATGSDLEGCRKAVARLPELLQKAPEGAMWPFLHEMHMGQAAAEEHQAYVDRMTPVFSEIDRYAQFMHPEAKTWWAEDPHNLLTWKDRNLAVAACLALRVWASGDPASLEGFKRLVLGCAREIEGIRQAYKEGRGDLAEYSLFALTIGLGSHRRDGRVLR